MKDLLDYILRSIVENPDAIEIFEEKSEEALLFRVKSDQNDKRIIIGKEGRTISAIRQLLNIKSRQAKRIEIQLVE